MSPNKTFSRRDDSGAGSNNPVVQQVIRENRKLILESLEPDALGVADYLFERGFFTRDDYHAVDDAPEHNAANGSNSSNANSVSILSLTSSPAAQRTQKLIDILATKDKDVVNGLLEYLEDSKRKKSSAGETSTQPQQSLTLLERLKSSREKFTEIVESPIHSNVNVNSNTTIITIDSSDFTMTLKSLEKISKEIIRKSPIAFRNWHTVLESMNGLTKHDIDQIDHDIKRLKEKIKSRSSLTPITYVFEELDLLDMENWTREEDLEWESIIYNSFLMWKHKNLNNATFFSLVGVLQHSRMFKIADKLMSIKHEIQNSK